MAEYFDVLDNNGKPTGQIKTRSEVHRDGDWHRSVDIWVIDAKKEVLIQKRSANKESYPSLWEVSCSGHVGAGEDSITAALRETEEELGLKITKDQLQFLFEDKEISITNNNTFINYEFKEVYLVEADLPLNAFKLQTEEVAEVKYVYYKELEELVGTKSSEFVPHEKLYRSFFEILRKKFQ